MICHTHLPSSLVFLARLEFPIKKVSRTISTLKEKTGTKNKTKQQKAMGSIMHDRTQSLYTQLEYCTPVLNTLATSSRQDNEMSEKLCALHDLRRQVTLVTEDGDGNSIGSYSSGRRPKFKRDDYLVKISQALRSYKKQQQEPTPSTKHANSRTKENEAIVREMEWVFIGTAAISVYGIVLQSLLDQTVPLEDDLYYWDTVSSSTRNLIYYSIQTAPLRGFRLITDTYRDASRRLGGSVRRSTSNSQTYDWVNVIKESLNARRQQLASISLGRASRAVDMLVYPMYMTRREVRLKRRRLQNLRELQNSGLGLLVSKGIEFDGNQSWHKSVESGIYNVQQVLQELCNVDERETFEQKVIQPRKISTLSITPLTVADRLLNIVDDAIPRQAEYHKEILVEAGRPTFFVRQWPTLVLGLTFGSTLLQIVFNRKADIKQWILDSGNVIKDFWSNWVIEPASKLIQTIRHDDASQIAITSKQSLESDLESLERMVIDYVIDRNNGSELSPSQVSILKERVGQGDLSTILRAYELALKHPIKNALRGDLIRTLLIQIQKTKVDVEVAISGIDHLLKSQELLFGFLAATPSTIICYFTTRHLYGIYNGRSLLNNKDNGLRAIRTLRKISRILTLGEHKSFLVEQESSASPASSVSSLGASSSIHHHNNNNLLFLAFAAHGEILCEVYVLRNLSFLIPKMQRHEWIQDLQDLEKIDLGVKLQQETLERIWTVYREYLV